MRGFWALSINTTPDITLFNIQTSNPVIRGSPNYRMLGISKEENMYFIFRVDWMPISCIMLGTFSSHIDSNKTFCNCLRSGDSFRNLTKQFRITINTRAHNLRSRNAILLMKFFFIFSYVTLLRLPLQRTLSRYLKRVDITSSKNSKRRLGAAW